MFVDPTCAITQNVKSDFSLHVTHFKKKPNAGSLISKYIYTQLDKQELNICFSFLI